MAKKQIVASMRAFTSSSLKLSLINSKTIKTADGNDEKLNAPFLVNAIAILGGLFVLGLGWILFPYSITIARKLIPHYFSWLGIWFIALIITAIMFGIISDKESRRWKLFSRINALRFQESGQLPGDLISSTGISKSFSLKMPKTYSLSFGLSKSWFDFDSERPVPNLDKIIDGVKEIMFVRIGLPQLDHPPIYSNPRRPFEVEKFTYMDSKAQATLADLCSKYSVVIGNRAILISYAASSTLPIEESMHSTHLSNESTWVLFSALISGPLADVVEGLNFD